MKLLWIDDQKSVSDPDVLFLRTEGIDIDCAPTGESGLSLARQGSYDVVLLDLRLPDIPGLAVLTTLRAEGNKSPILVITGFGDFESARMAGYLGASGYRAKPIFFDEILLAVNTVPSVDTQNRQLIDTSKPAIN